MQKINKIEMEMINMKKKKKPSINVVILGLADEGICGQENRSEEFIQNAADRFRVKKV